MVDLVENGRAVSDLFGVDAQQEKRIVVDECLGCKEDIYQGEEVLKHPDGLFHDDEGCFVTYIRDCSTYDIA